MSTEPALDPTTSAPPWCSPGFVPFTVEALPERIDLDELDSGQEHLGLGVGVGAFAVDEDRGAIGFTPSARRRLVLGPPHSGRTSALRAMAVASSRAGDVIVFVAAHGQSMSPFPDKFGGMREGSGSATGAVLWCPPDVVKVTSTLCRAKERLAHLERQGLATPALHVIVDDADLLVGTEVESLLVRELSSASGQVVVSAAAETSRFSGQFRGLAVDVARNRTGLLLAPSSTLDGQLLAANVPSLPQAIPGRGWLIERGVLSLIQVGWVAA